MGPKEARRRLHQYGPNQLKTRKQRAAWRILVDQFMNLIVMLLAVALSIALLLLAVYFHPLAKVLTLAMPTAGEWLFILGMSLIPMVVVQVLKQFTCLNPFGKDTLKEATEKVVPEP
ncbi:MAG: cation-transporting P-type ATPase [Desulfobulbaceae bacterium]|nr:cation-transporting P-type ATPase [Desulfobulbaceae bacterium]